MPAEQTDAEAQDGERDGDQHTPGAGGDQPLDSTTGTSCHQARPTTAAMVTAVATALSQSAEGDDGDQLAGIDRPRRGMKLSQLAIDPELNSAPMKLPPIISAVIATR